VSAARRRVGWVGWLTALVLLTVGCGFGQTGSAWVFPSPQPLPEGATAVPIDVAPVPTTIADDVQFGCPMALLGPTELVVDRSVSPPTVSYRLAGTGEPIHLEWSWGVSAYELDGVVRIVGPTGVEVMTEGRVAEGLGGGGGGDPNTFNVCLGNSLPRRVGD
jgi:hypothetical protein